MTKIGKPGTAIISEFLPKKKVVKKKASKPAVKKKVVAKKVAKPAAKKKPTKKRARKALKDVAGNTENNGEDDGAAAEATKGSRPTKKARAVAAIAEEAE